jgi:hypothetical protein
MCRDLSLPILSRRFGIRLGHDPQIDEDDSIGRDDELEQLQTWLVL